MQGLGCRVQGADINMFWANVLDCRVYGLRFRVNGSGYWDCRIGCETYPAAAKISFRV